MLTRAGKVMANMILDNSLLVAKPTGNPKCSIEFKDTSGTTKYFSPIPTTSGTGSNVQFSAITGTMPGIYVGSGGSAATEDDYTLEQQITTGLSAAGSTAPVIYGYDSDNNEITVSYVITLTNSSSSDITVRELGKTALCYTGESIGSDPNTTSSNRKTVLLDRTVLESPVVIEASGSAVLHYTFKYPGYVAS